NSNSITIFETIPTGTYKGIIYVRDITTGCEAQNSINLIIDGPEIVNATISPTCVGAANTYTFINFSSIGSVNEYSIDWDNLPDIQWSPLISNSTIRLEDLPLISGTYTGKLFLRNSSSGC